MDKLPISKEKASKEKGGFTLVELSIVLVIIGLLIGGILVAQSMITTAKINATVRQIGQFDVMVTNFKESYHYLPGDAPAFGGNGDGIISCGTFCGIAVTVFVCEIANFWSALDSTTYQSVPCSLPGGKAVTSGPNKNVPLAKLGTPGDYFIASAISGTVPGSADTVNIRNFYAIVSAAQAQNLSVWNLYHFNMTTSANSAVSPADLAALDGKIDDGAANAGNILSGAIIDEGDGAYGGIGAIPLATCSVGSSYLTSNSGNECTPLIRIGGSVGLPQ